jgi:hypothetical protein
MWGCIPQLTVDARVS